MLLFFCFTFLSAPVDDDDTTNYLQREKTSTRFTPRQLHIRMSLCNMNKVLLLQK